MRILLATLLAMLTMLTGAGAEVVIYNHANEDLVCEWTQPNGDTRKLDIKPNTGYGPSQTRLDPGGASQVTFRVLSESGQEVARATSPDFRVFLLHQQGDAFKLERVSWFKDNGQKHRRAFVLFNGTEVPLKLDIIDAKKVRRDVLLQPGEKQEFDGKDGFDGSRHHFVFKDASGSELQRKERVVGNGYFHVIHQKRGSKANEFEVGSYGWITPPRGAKD